MRKIYLLLAVFVFTASFALCQYKSELENQNGGMPQILKSQENTILGLFNPENFSMKHSYTMSYSSLGGNGLALGMYTNSMNYKFTENLNVRADVSLIHSPFSSYSKGVTDNLTGIYLSRAEINYKPYDNVYIQLKYNKSPYSYYDPLYSGLNRYGYLGYYNDPFYDFSK